MRALLTTCCLLHFTGSIVFSSPTSVTLSLPPYLDVVKEGSIVIPGMLCPTRVAGSVDVVLNGTLYTMPHVECIKCNAPCGEGGRGECRNYVDHRGGKVWRRGCQCHYPTEEVCRAGCAATCA
ncbi:hypothetical protein E2C01_101203 [Portunus trituberculatus]|uniref:Uncharacterized protein n=1 Tax=Portunus trituberculatus TaxID=210409 RepID=A0A5B7KJJ0_PORTR|nr:hypothetical protein [Portunus trituberculatus]